MSFFRNMKLTTAVGLVFLAGFFIPSLIACYLATRYQGHVLSRELRQDQERTVQVLCRGLSEAVWTLVPDMGIPLVEAVMTDRRIQSVTVYSEDGVFIEKKRSGEGDSQGGASSARYAQAVSKPVLYHGKPIGTVSVVIDTRSMAQVLNRQQSRYIWISLGPFVFSAVILFWVIRMKILSPIRKLIRQSEDLAHKKLDTEFRWDRRDEMGVLGLSFEQTRQSLLMLFDELEQTNKQLKDEVAQRRKIEARLIRHQDALEVIIDERTRALTTANDGLKQQIEHRSKMEASLKKSRADLQKVSSQIEQLSLAAAQMISISDTKQLFQKICDAIVAYSDYSRVVISLFKKAPPYREIIGSAGIDRAQVDSFRHVEAPIGWFESVFEKGIPVGRMSCYVPSGMTRLLDSQGLEKYMEASVDKSGRWHPEANLFVRMHDEKGGFLGVITVDQAKSGDIPGQEKVRPLEIFSSLISQIIILRREQEKRRLAEAQLQQALKLESIGTLAGGIAHDFNNILGIILGNTELAQADLDPEMPAFNSLESVKTASHRAAEIVSQLLSFSRVTEHELTPVDIIPVVTETLSFLRASVPATIRIRHRFYQPRVVAMADSIQINQIIMNLCINAYHAMEGEKGTIEVRVGVESSAPPGTGLAPGGYAVIAISDDGAGIPPEIKDRIFDPYFTTKEVGKGSGMGLSVVAGIVKAHKGAVTVDSDPGKGTRFSVFLPMARTDSQPGPADSKPLLKGSGQILFVDDDRPLNEMFQTMLTTMGYSVQAFTDPRMALAAFERDPDRFDLVITDMTMPGLTGADLTVKMRKIRASLPIIICTGHSDIMDEQAASAIHIDAYVTKPVEMHTMSRVIRSVLEKYARPA